MSSPFNLIFHRASFFMYDGSVNLREIVLAHLSMKKLPLPVVVWHSAGTQGYELSCFDQVSC